jgi:hypothetical protein
MDMQAPIEPTGGRSSSNLDVCAMNRDASEREMQIIFQDRA